MELVNDFTVNVPVEEAWVVLTDVERIAPCLPGAQLQEVEGDVYRGVVKIKVGPILAQFKGQATFVEKDDSGHKAVLKAEGRDTAGKGNASALITAKLDPQGEGVTKVTVSTDLTITGKVAQFGRGALADVSTKLLGQFVDCLETTVLGPGAAVPAPAPSATADAMEAKAAGAAAAPPGADTSATSAPSASSPGTDTGVRRVAQPDAQPIDLLDAAGAPLAKRLIPAGVVLVILFLLLRRRRRSD
jgi:carbon monoxide dehydrogenase subunit G